jgi:hypothetical protein
MQYHNPGSGVVEWGGLGYELRYTHNDSGGVWNIIISRDISRNL